MLLPVSVLTALTGACGGQPEAVPSLAWHEHGTTGSTSSTGSSSGSSSGGGSGSSGAASSSSGGSSGASSSGGESGSSSGSSGSGGAAASSGGPSSGNPDAVAVSVDKSTLSVPLMDSAVVNVSVAPNGYSGTMTLAAASLPSNVTAAFAPATVTLDGSTTATAVLTLTTTSDVAPGTAGFSVTASAGGATQTASVSLTVQSVITLHIPAGVNDTGATVSNPNSTAFGPYPITIVAPQNISASNPVTVYFKNDDTVAHEIHADDAAQGFAHDPGPFGAGQMDPFVRNVNSAGTYDFYLHDQGAPITIGRVFIQAGQ
jgi:plastocyanin